MIVYELRCGADHGFDAWFRNSDAYEQQRTAEQVTCPHCGSREIAKAPMAPRIGKGGRSSESRAPETAEQSAPQSPATTPVPGQMQPEQMRMVMSQIAELNRKIAETCDYVGPAFPEEARKIHYGEAEHREIYGEASPEEAAALQDEGVSIAAVPWIRRTDS